jgi:hypothetical protein
MSQRTVNDCDICGAKDLDHEPVVVSFQGTGAERLKARLAAGRPSADLCSECTDSLGGWIDSRRVKVESKVDVAPVEIPQALGSLKLDVSKAPLVALVSQPTV